MERQILVITQAELRGLKYGQDIITETSRQSASGRRAVQATKGFIDGLLENLQNGIPVDANKLERLRDHYVQLIDIDLEFIESASQLLWRQVQDQENADRHENEVERGVNS